MRTADLSLFLFMIMCLRENLPEVSTEKPNAGLLHPTYPGLDWCQAFGLRGLRRNVSRSLGVHAESGRGRQQVSCITRSAFPAPAPSMTSRDLRHVP